MTEAGARQKVGERIRQCRQQAGLTQLDLARATGCTSQAISRWELGRTNPSFQNCRTLAPVLGVSLDYLAFGIRTAPVGEPAVIGQVLGRPGGEVPACEK